MAAAIRGSITEIIRNDDNLYVGNMRYYYWATWQFAKNLMNLFHGYGHVFHVVWRVWEGCKYHRNELTPEDMRAVLVAALFHDWDHPGVSGHDDLNIIRAVRGFREHCVPRDKKIEERVVRLMESTQFPYVVDASKLDLVGLILRDADMMQTLGPAWVQPVIMGLAGEWRRTPLQILEIQPGFVGKLKFHTKWAQSLFAQADIDAKRDEAQEHLDLATNEPPKE